MGKPSKILSRTQSKEHTNEKNVKKPKNLVIWYFIPTFETIFLISGIYVFFLLFGYYQETIYKIGEDKNKFHYPIFLVFCLCVSNILTSGIVLLIEYYTGLNLIDVSPPSIDDIGSKNTLFDPQDPYQDKYETTSPSISELDETTQESKDYEDKTMAAVAENQPTKQKEKKKIDRQSELDVELPTTFWKKYVTSIQNDILFEIAVTATTYILSMVCTNYALNHVNYPTQVLVKSAKCVPVILGGRLFFSKKYASADYIVVGLVTLSLICFNFTTSKTSTIKTIPVQDTIYQKFVGWSLLLISLFCDSLTGPRQDNLLKHIKITSTHLMFLTNLFAAWIISFSFMLFESYSLYFFIITHREVIYYTVCFSISASLGQLFIFGSLTALGSLQLTLITTTRKFFTVLLSILLFGHSLNVLQWLTVIIIFGSLTFHGYHTKRIKLETKQKSE